MSRGLEGLAAAALAAAACAGGPPAAGGRPAQPEGWDSAVTLPGVQDLDSSSNVVELNLDARVASLTFLPGTTTPAWTYNGTIPGPLIRAHVGDRVIAHFTNHLPEDSTVHWHGIRLTADMDGVPGHTQPPVPPGGSFDYSFVVPDPGLFWYHPTSTRPPRWATGSTARSSSRIRPNPIATRRRRSATSSCSCCPTSISTPTAPSSIRPRAAASARCSDARATRCSSTVR